MDIRDQTTGVEPAAAPIVTRGSMPLRDHLRNATRIGIAMVAWSGFSLVGKVIVRVLIFRRPLEWRVELMAIGVMTVLFVLGGFLYSVILPFCLRRLRYPRLGAGAAAGLLTALPLALRYLRRTPRPDEFSHGGFFVLAISMGILFGVVIALVSHHVWPWVREYAQALRRARAAGRAADMSRPTRK